MTTARFSLAGFASRVFEAETWMKMISECFGTRTSVNTSRMESTNETKWELTLKRQQSEARSLCHQAIHQLVPMAGAYQMSVLDTVSQAGTVYAPAEAEVVFQEGNKKVEEISGHISGILFNARKMREASRQTNKVEDVHVRSVMYHNSVMPYIDTLRFHIDRLKHIMSIA